MNEYIKTDVGEYLTSRTGSFEKSPPDELWNNIERSIPVYSGFSSSKSIIKYLIGGISLSAIVIAFLLIYQPFSNKTENTTATIAKSQVPLNMDKDKVSKQNIIITTDISEKNDIITENSFQHNSINVTNTQTKKENTSSTEEPIKKQSITYSINASGLKNVTAISFVNEKNETLLTSKYPTPNAFGFYIIDISQLSKGTYNIMLTTPDGVKLHKKEIFK